MLEGRHDAYYRARYKICIYAYTDEAHFMMLARIDACIIDIHVIRSVYMEKNLAYCCYTNRYAEQNRKAMSKLNEANHHDDRSRSITVGS